MSYLFGCIPYKFMGHSPQKGRTSRVQVSQSAGSPHSAIVSLFRLYGPKSNANSAHESGIYRAMQPYRRLLKTLYMQPLSCVRDWEQGALCLTIARTRMDAAQIETLQKSKSHWAETSKQIFKHLDTKRPCGRELCPRAHPTATIMVDSPNACQAARERHRSNGTFPELPGTAYIYIYMYIYGTPPKIYSGHSQV